MPVMVVPTSSATVAIASFITELSSVMRNCPAASVINTVEAACAAAARAVLSIQRTWRRRLGRRAARAASRRHRDGRTTPRSPAVSTTVIALWLGHEQTDTTMIYLHADLTLKESLPPATPHG